jgi:acyl-CoA synthetase (AMP-forming)/AMP-acid ligase II
VDLRILRIVRAPLGEIDTAAFDALCLQPGFIGEIVVVGDHVLTGYLHGRGDAETKIRCGGRVWHRTGDAGRLDADGNLWLQGRVSALIERGDHKLFPFGVECAASEQAGVFRSALVRHGGHVVLVVQIEPGSDREDIARQLHAQLGWARLDRILFVDVLPVDARHNAKVDYPALERLLARVDSRG